MTWRLIREEDFVLARFLDTAVDLAHSDSTLPSALSAFYFQLFPFRTPRLPSSVF